jgi:hypothetical protein
MAVGAAHLALRKLGFNRAPGVSGVDEDADGCSLLEPINVIKLEHNRIRLATVNATVRQQVLPQAA